MDFLRDRHTRRFRRALDRGDALAALSAAAELGDVGLTDALELCLLLAREDQGRFPRAALRWHGRYCREVRHVSPEEAQAVLALLVMLSGERAVPAARALAELLNRRGLERVTELLLCSADLQEDG